MVQASDGVVKALFNSKTTYQLVKKIHLFHLRDSSIMLFRSVSSFAKERLWYNSLSPNDVQYYIYIDSTTMEEIELIIKFTFPHQYSYFLFEEGDFIRLMTFVWYTPNKCSTPQLIEVNKFNKASMKWQNKVFKIEKFKNLHGCILNFEFDQGQPEYLIKEAKREGKNLIVKKCLGYLCNVAEDIKKSLNFTYVSYIEYDETRIKINFSWQVTHLNVASRFRDGKSSTSWISSCMRPIKADNLYIVITPGEKYNGYEKLLLPFDKPTWFYIAFTFGVAFASVFVASFSQTMRDFVFGPNVPTPGMNIVRALFGISQVQMPVRNFAKFILILLLIFTLIIRTAFQGKMFEFLQKDIRKPTLETIEELMEQSYTFFMPIKFKTYFNDSELAQQ